ncbi:MAG TPA: Crp/Fnr family transcriptional regulator [Brumimicrobium sp.]|nr:Crp/Fnr family transcriptional regulator [Brumimicrobium sp.]
MIKNKNKTKIWILNSIQMFEGLSLSQKSNLLNAIKEVKYNKNEIVFQVGDKMDQVYFIAQGRVKIIKMNNDEKETIKRILNSGDYFGEFSIIDPEKFISFKDTAKVMDADTICFSLPSELFMQVCEEHSFVFQSLLKNIVANYIKLDSRLDSVMMRKSKMRIVDFIEEMAEDIGTPVGYDVLIKHNLTHQDMANITGISRQKVTTILNEFKQEGLIHLERNTILVHDKRLFQEAV